jgi:hypothetical protein
MNALVLFIGRHPRILPPPVSAARHYWQGFKLREQRRCDFLDHELKYSGTIKIALIAFLK